MKGLRLFLGALAAVVALAGSAQACTSGRVRTYFSYERPNVTGSSIRLLVTIPDGEVRDRGTIRARLVSGEGDLADNGYVRVWLGEPAVGTNCVSLGPTDGPVFVTGTLRRSPGRELLLIAEATYQPRSRSILPRGRRDPAFYDQYIVDPAYLTPEVRRRREARPDDRP